jgi:hypothetical protein
MGFLSKCVMRIEQAKPEDKQDVLQRMLLDIYDERHLSAMLLGLYAKTIYVRDYKLQISEAIEASFSGLHYAAVSTMIPVLEGIIRKVAKAEQRDVGSGTKKIIDELNHILNKELNSPHRFDERVVMLTSLKNFFSDRLLSSTANYNGLDEFNRHGILHGIFGDYGSATNFFRCITILELLCFVMALSYGGSCFAPEETVESLNLSEYYSSLKLALIKAAPMRSLVRQ